MKKKLMCGLMLSVSLFSIAAYADEEDDKLTTKGYVNSGLQFVYDVATGKSNGTVKNLQQSVNNMENALSDGNGGLIDVGNLAEQLGTAGANETPGTGLTGKVEALQTAVGNDSSGLVKEIADLKDTVGDNTKGLVKKVNSLVESSKTYNAGAGIEVKAGATDSDPSTIGIALPANAPDGTKYVFQSDGQGGGTWIKMQVANTWNSDFLTTP